MRKKKIFPELNESTNSSLFSPVNKVNRTREAKPSTFSEAQFVCGIMRRQENRLGRKGESPRLKPEGGAP